MIAVVGISILSLCCFVFTVMLFSHKSPVYIISAALGFVFFVFTVGLISPEELGFGHVPDKAEAFTKRLEVGVAYQLLSSSKEGGDQVLLVKKVGTKKIISPRVKEVPPEHFTLIDGKPVAIVAPTPPVGAK